MIVPIFFLETVFHLELLRIRCGSLNIHMQLKVFPWQLMARVLLVKTILQDCFGIMNIYACFMTRSMRQCFNYLQNALFTKGWPLVSIGATRQKPRELKTWMIFFNLCFPNMHSMPNMLEKEVHIDFFLCLFYNIWSFHNEKIGVGKKIDSNFYFQGQRCNEEVY